MHIVNMWYLALVSYMILIIKHAVDSAFITIQSKYSNEPYIVISRDGDEALTFIGIGDYGIGGTNGMTMSAIDGKFDSDFLNDHKAHLSYTNGEIGSVANSTETVDLSIDLLINSEKPEKGFANEMETDVLFSIESLLALEKKNANDNITCFKLNEEKSRHYLRGCDDCNSYNGGDAFFNFSILDSLFRYLPDFPSQTKRLSNCTTAGTCYTPSRNGNKAKDQSKIIREGGGGGGGGGGSRNKFYQLETAAAMGTWASYNTASFVVALGDNYYKNGVKSSDDILWEYLWTNIYLDPYEGLRIPWFAIAGNHDYYPYGYGAYSPIAQVQRTKEHPDGYWQMDALNYTKKFCIPGGGFLQIIFIDTTTLNPYANKCTNMNGGVSEQTMLARYNDQMANVKRMLEETRIDKPKWLLVVGHYPVYSVGDNGGQANLVYSLEPLFQEYGVHAYICGHDHVAEHLQMNNVEYFVSGGGAMMGTIGKTSTAAQVKWTYATTTSFSTFHATNATLTVNFWDNSGNKIYSHTLTNPNANYTDPYEANCTDPYKANCTYEEPSNNPTSMPTSFASSAPTTAPTIAVETVDRIANYHSSQKYNVAIVMGLIFTFLAGIVWKFKKPRNNSIKFDKPQVVMPNRNRSDYRFGSESHIKNQDQSERLAIQERGSFFDETESSDSIKRLTNYYSNTDSTGYSPIYFSSANSTEDEQFGQDHYRSSTSEDGAGYIAATNDDTITDTSYSLATSESNLTPFTGTGSSEFYLEKSRHRK